MKKLQGQFTENTIKVLNFKALSANEMNKVRGGIRPKSRDRDIFDMES